MHVLVAERNRLASGNGVQVDQQMVVAAVGHNITGWRYLHTLYAKAYFEGAGHGSVVGGLQDRHGLQHRGKPVSEGFVSEYLFL
jgi:hypothetical protein